MTDAHPHHLATFEVILFGFDGVDSAHDVVADLKAKPNRITSKVAR